MTGRDGRQTCWPVRADRVEKLPHQVAEGTGRLRVDADPAAVGVYRRCLGPSGHVGGHVPGDVCVRGRRRTQLRERGLRTYGAAIRDQGPATYVRTSLGPILACQ